MDYNFKKKNWRTASRYIEAITKETGLIETRTFREGTRGALRIVFWNALDSSTSTSYQKRLLNKIMTGRKKEDFSPFDIYQFVNKEKRKAFLENTEYSTKHPIKLDRLLMQAKNQILFFSGNLSWMELRKNINPILMKSAKNKVSIKILTRVDVTSKKNTENMLNINIRCGWDAVNIRHCEQPLRAIIIDDKLFTIKEVLNPFYYRKNELKKKTFIFYLVEDEEWISWLQKVFWNLWEQSIDANERIDALNSINNLKVL